MQPTTRPSNPNIKVQFAILFVFVMDGSYAAESIINHGPLMMAIRDRFVGAVHRLSNKYLLARTNCHPNPLPGGLIRPRTDACDPLPPLSFSSPGDAIRLSFPG
jgi:hypothetical protein